MSPATDAVAIGAAWLALSLLGCASAAEPQQSPVPVAPTVGTPAPAMTNVPAPTQAPAPTATSSPSPAPSASTPSSAVDQASPATPSENDPAETAALAKMSDTQRVVLTTVKACIERGLKKNEAPKGSLAIELTLAADGSVASMKLADGYPPGIRACVDAKLRATQFPPGASARFFRFPINETSQSAD